MWKEISNKKHHSKHKKTTQTLERRKKHQASEIDENSFESYNQDLHLPNEEDWSTYCNLRFATLRGFSKSLKHILPKGGLHGDESHGAIRTKHFKTTNPSPCMKWNIYLTVHPINLSHGSEKKSMDLRKTSSTLRIQSPCQMIIGVYSHLLSKVFRFHYHSQKVIGSLGQRNKSK